LEAELTPLEASPDVEVIRLASAMADAIELVQPLAAGRGVAISGVPADPSPSVIATPTILRQIFLNVLSGLIGAHAPACLRVELIGGATSAEIQVTPIRPREVGNLEGAAALPLLAARRLAEGQEVTLATESLGSGATAARLRFPTTAAPLVLIVDDNPDLVRLFRRYLQGKDVRLIPARNGARAHGLVRTLHPDVVILDLMMPVQDGWDLFRALRADPDTAATPVIACSVLPERELALSLGVDGFLAKPVTGESLAAALIPYCRSRTSAGVAGTSPDRP
jgi:CheY-like chemotaxis protein